jgi:hypothetical protein
MLVRLLAFSLLDCGVARIAILWPSYRLVVAMGVRSLVALVWPVVAVVILFVFGIL